MQLLLQVLNKELGVENGGSSHSLELEVSSDGDDSFAALIAEKPRADDDHFPIVATPLSYAKEKLPDTATDYSPQFVTRTASVQAAENKHHTLNRVDDQGLETPLQPANPVKSKDKLPVTDTDYSLQFVPRAALVQAADNNRHHNLISVDDQRLETPLPPAHFVKSVAEVSVSKWSQYGRHPVRAVSTPRSQQSIESPEQSADPQKLHLHQYKIQPPVAASEKAAPFVFGQTEKPDRLIAALPVQGESVRIIAADALGPADRAPERSELTGVALDNAGKSAQKHEQDPLQPDPSSKSTKAERSQPAPDTTTLTLALKPDARESKTSIPDQIRPLAQGRVETRQSIAFAARTFATGGGVRAVPLASARAISQSSPVIFRHTIKSDAAPQVAATPTPLKADPALPVSLSTPTGVNAEFVQVDPKIAAEPPQSLQEGPFGVSGVEGTENRRSPEPFRQNVEPLARPVVTQLVQAAKSAVDGMFEVRLSPEELGRVRLVMTSGDVGMTVQIAAERPETLDLIRRNIDLLAADLLKQGFADLNFSFTQDGSTGNSDVPAEVGDQERGDARQVMQVDDPEKEPLIQPDGRVDLRL